MTFFLACRRYNLSKGGGDVKQVIYIDVLIFLNTAITFLLLLAVSKLTKLTPSAGRYVIGSLLGGASSLIIFAPEMGFILSLLTKLLFSVVIVSLTYNSRSIKSIGKQVGYFFAVSFIFAGMMLWVSSLPGISIVSYNNGVAYIDVSMFSLIASAVICYVVTSVLNIVTRHRYEGGILYNIRITKDGKTVSSSAILDTGNALTDPFSGESLIISSRRTVEKVLPTDIKHYFDGDTDNCKAVRLIPCSTVTAESLLPVFRADEVIVSADELSINLKNVGIAVCNIEMDNIILPPEIAENCDRRKKYEKIYN